MKVGVFTSSRADYGIYFPLLKKLAEDNEVDLNLLVFGTHLSSKYGHTVEQIETDGFNIKHRVETLPGDDSPMAISKSIAKTISSFSEIWSSESFDLLIALGDRYEMFGAVASTVPFNIPIAHIHGGETTLGAIDNSLRHCITSMASLHFTACEEYRQRVVSICGYSHNVFNVGALSIDSLMMTPFLSVEEFFDKFNIDLRIPTILFTFHPETVQFSKNEEYIKIIIASLEEVKGYQIVITMPNADTAGEIVRSRLIEFIQANSNAVGVESFGSLGYLSCMKHCSFMMGNTSSGFIEASYFQKPVINLGERQKGRIETDNIFTCSIQKDEIKKAIERAKEYRRLQPITIYGNGSAALKINKHIKEFCLQK